MNKTSLAILEYLSLCNNGYAGDTVMLPELKRKGEFGNELCIAICSLTKHGHICNLGTVKTYGNLYCLPEDYDNVVATFREMGMKYNPTVYTPIISE